MMYGTKIGIFSKVEITSEGKSAHDSDRFDNSDKGEVLIALNDKGASSITAIADYGNMSDQESLSAVKELIRMGLVKPANQEMAHAPIGEPEEDLEEPEF